ncbi:MAG: hypothetical protein WAV07_06965 [Candidatus Contendobacter sp.]
MSFREQVVELTGRNLDLPVVQLGQQQRLGHMGMVVLMQQVTDPPQPVMAAPDRRRRHRRGYVLPGGEPPLLQQVTGIVGANLQILHHKPPIAFELRAVRYVGQGDPFGGVYLQCRRLGPLRTPAPRRIAVRFRRRRSGWFQCVRLQLGTRRTALQPPKLVLQPLNLFLLLADDPQQNPHHGGLVARGDLGQFRVEGRDKHGI